MSFHATESHLFGSVSLSCAASPSVANDLSVRRVRCEPMLPDGMAVDSVDGYIIEMASPAAIHNFSFDLVLHECDAKGDVESGEHRAAQSWQIGQGLLLVGTEDGDALNARMPWVPMDGQRHPLRYLPNGFRLTLDYIPPKTHLGFHFVLAYNQTECEKPIRVVRRGHPACELRRIRGGKNPRRTTHELTTR